MKVVSDRFVPGRRLRVAIVHEWLDTYAGSERVLEQLLRSYPEADVFAVVDFLTGPDREMLRGRKVTTSFIQRLPGARKRFRNYLQLMPIAVEQFDLAGYDLILSSHHAVAKGVITGPDQVHVCYVHSPMRYAWDMQAEYLHQSGMERGLRSLYARWLLHRLRGFDVRSANGVDLFIANSRYIARRIRKAYRRDAEVVAPPVDVQRFQPGHDTRRDYVVVSRMVPYKRVDLVVEAFRGLPDRRLLVIGDGTEREKIAALASGAPNIELLGRLPQDALLRTLQQARAFVFAAEEDFGIAMVEAQACGTPLIVYGRGGAADIIDPDAGPPTGVLFDEQTPEAIRNAVWRFERDEALMTPERCRANALRFSPDAFARGIAEAVARALDEARRNGAPIPATDSQPIFHRHGAL
ncbi:glycosyltransferase involved in cell wall biosynthesis [Endobacter medicaginis]|uniref:Glycosyltransferase n=1 Tax=Endobacter medicaginis TaxID=1181271 RepID=A0A839UY02_9PROT|nr:glycosyltransferase [Endobacter medicaginis]MBB3174646.1 glycosyltransferase involved in cell wall biosynthesis [Endobacter medicaginis]MCX5474662.1 glycosyltransferase [Endobacter medicaginis]NVN30135.1 glycosyltransferase [Endobacter medicaginis]